MLRAAVGRIASTTVRLGRPTARRITSMAASNRLAPAASSRSLSIHRTVASLPPPTTCRWGREVSRPLFTGVTATPTAEPLFNPETKVFRAPLDAPESLLATQVPMVADILHAAAEDPDHVLLRDADFGDGKDAFGHATSERTFAMIESVVRGVGAGLIVDGVAAPRGPGAEHLAAEHARGPCYPPAPSGVELVGDTPVVAIVMQNHVDYAAICHGIGLAGCVATPVNPSYTTEETSRQLTASGSSAVFTTVEMLPHVAEAVAAHNAGAGGESNAPAVRAVYVAGSSTAACPRAEEAAAKFRGAVAGVEVHSLPSLIARGAPLAGHVGDGSDLDPEAPFVLPFSSGTTGLPKGVVLTHANIAANVKQVMAVEDYTRADVLLQVLPTFHVFGFAINACVGLVLGVPTIVMPKFDFPVFLGSIQRYGATVIHVAPPIAVALAKHPVVDRFDLSSVRCIFSGAAPLSPETEHEVCERLSRTGAKCEVRQAYGMTELSPASHISPPGKVRAGFVGPLVPGCEAVIEDIETGARLGPGERGALLVRGPNVMRGYTNAAANEETFAEEGFLRTGDVAVAEEDGYFAIVDRTKELIKVSGYQVPPAELEAVLLTHPAVADAGVVGIPDESRGEVPLAFVSLKAEDGATASEIREYVAGKVTSYKRLAEVRIIPEVPKTPSGKILRKDLRELVLSTAK